jgi:hypothetical protein
MITEPSTQMALGPDLTVPIGPTTIFTLQVNPIYGFKASKRQTTFSVVFSYDINTRSSGGGFVQDSIL